MADIQNPGAAVQYNSANPFNVNVPGTGNFSGAEMNSAQGADANGNANAITSASLAPATPIPYVTPTPTPIPSIASLNAESTPPLTPTDAETKESGISTELQALNDSTVGKSAYQTQENTANGVDALTAQQTDLSTQLTNLKDQADAIPQQLQLDATGRGITAGGLAPVSTAALRNNSIQALGVSAMLDATKGLLATAQTKADQAVAAKYDPITEQINAATANLKLIQNDPATTLEDKNRAQAQADVLASKAAAVATAKQNMTDVMTAAISAAKNGADAVTLQKIQQAPDGATALQIATQAGYGNSDVNDLLTKYPDAQIQPGDTLAQAQQKVMQSPTYTMAQKTAMLDNAVKVATIKKDQQAQTDLSTNQQTIITSLNTQLANSDAGKTFPHIADVYASVQNIDPNTTDPTQQAQLALALAQMEVPGSKSVRGALNAANNTDMNPGVWNLLDSAEKMVSSHGSISPNQMQSITAAMSSIYDAQAAQYTQARSAVVGAAVARGIPGADQYLTNYAADSGVGEARAKNAVNTYIQNNPKMLQKVTQAMQIPGITEQDMLTYMKNPASGFDNYGALP